MMGVAELAKLPGVWCTHARKRDGCAIYEDRPGLPELLVRVAGVDRRP
jgi:hypothetical protein